MLSCVYSPPLLDSIMVTLLEIEAAIKQLPENDIRQLSGWLQSFMDEMWNRPIP
jgi:hypothetical protein